MQPHHQRVDGGGGEPIAAPHQKGGHLPQPDAGLTAREACATLHDDDCGDGTGENKDLFSCSCPSAPLSSACSISSASGLSNSVLSHSLAGQTTTPLSMEGSESHEPAVRRLGGPPTPFDAMAGLDELVTSPPRNALDETEQSLEGASNRPPTPPQPPPLSLDGSTSEREQQLRQMPPNLEEGHSNTHTQHDTRLAAPSPPSGHDIRREAVVGDTDVRRSPERGDGAFPPGTDAMSDAACTNGHARKCDDAGHAPQQLADATLVEHGAQCSAHMSAGCERADQDHQLQRGDERECCPTERAAAEPSIPDANARPSGLAGAPTHGPDPLNPSDSSASHRLCAPEHGSHRANRTIDSYAPELAAQDQKFGNTKPGSQNSSQTGTAPRDPPFPSGSSRPSHLPPSASRLSRSTSVPKSTEHIVQSSSDAPLFKPLVRTASDNSSLRMRHPKPDINTRTGALRGNIVQLEATAERLSSTTTSTEVAIRDLHSQLKRSDSQRSAAALARAGIQSPEREVDDSNRLRRPAFTRNYSASSSLTTRSTHSATASRYRRVRSGSLNAVMQSSTDTGPYMSRTGPGKGSVRSVRTGKQSLAEISESEPMNLTRAAFDEADRSNTIEDDDDTIRPQTGNDKTPKRGSFVPNTDAFHAMMDSGAQAPNPTYEYYHPEQRQTHRLSPQEQRPMTSASYASSTHNSAFRDFDGIHCDPELDLIPPPPQSQPMPAQHPAPSHTADPASAHPPRPTAYLDHETGQEMLYYPARVPAMLSLPPKLSRKPKAAARNQRQSQVLSTMPEASRKSGAAWLPDPLADNADNSFLNPISLDMNGSLETPTGQPGTEDDAPITTIPEEAAPPGPNHDAPEIQVTSTPGNAAAVDDDEVKPAVARPLKDAVSDVDMRKSRLSNLPPQLRASVFFDMPSTTTKLEVKDGSAMATLDHLLDASTHAPVSAFTDHMIAGKLGQEVYGAEKRQSAMPKPQPQPGPSTEAEPEPKKRVSVFHRFTKSKDLDRNERKETEHADTADDEALPPGAVGYATLRPDSDEFEDNDKDNDGKGSDEDDEEYHGPPTTLLAELQIRKQQQKNRTRPLNQPNGMHSTLLELDAVAEAQRKTRRGRKVNLAWEDPDPLAADAGSDDEDVPLGLLHAAKAAGTNDFVAATAELNRPLGLMERREMEENEPLSQRRSRLQGVDQGHRGRSLVLNPATRMSTNRLSAMPSLANLPVHTRAPSYGGAEQEEEDEGETLGERMRRLKREEEESLPKARPVSGAFSSELLSQFGDREDKKKEEEKDGEVAKDEEEEETLGQRRKRLQAEREAGGLRPVAHQQSASYSSSHGKRLSMAGILGAHPKRDTAHPQPEAERNKAVFGNGRFNDGTGGAGKRVSSRGMDVNWNKSNVTLGNGMIQQAGVNSMNSAAYNTVAGHAAGHTGGGAPQYGGPAQGWYPQQAPMGMPQPRMQGHVPMGMQVPMGAPMAMGMGMPPNQGPSDSIEQWRRSVMP